VDVDIEILDLTNYHSLSGVELGAGATDASIKLAIERYRENLKYFSGKLFASAEKKFLLDKVWLQVSIAGEIIRERIIDSHNDYTITPGALIELCIIWENKGL